MVVREEPAPSGIRLTCNVAAHAPDQGQELITGSATVALEYDISRRLNVQPAMLHYITFFRALGTLLVPRDL